ncbi:Anti-sigma B factor RsbT [Minicystis rosea]|nr:Anti-sigma B factor RsbT [Minicystis rosea]
MTISGPINSASSDVLDSVVNVLTRYVSMPTAQSTLSLARQRASIRGTELTRAQLGEMIDTLSKSLRLFVADPVKAQNCRRALEAIAFTDAAPAKAGPTSVLIRTEDDITRARTEARAIGASVGFTLIGQTRLMTAVSELARNIVLYAGEGQIQLTPSSAPAGVEIVARDHGPGIPNLTEVFSGNYRSRLGMGLGLLGVKKISERFDIQTAPRRGTTVTALLRVS